MLTNKRFNVTMVAIIKDEAPYLAEWLEYHMLLGIEHVYLYDNGSSDNSPEVLANYLIQGRVTLLSWPEFPGQLSAYNHAMNIFGRDSAWMAIIDVDEFIYLPDGQAIGGFLSAFGDDADQILLPWYHFGSSGHDEKPSGLVIENYVHRSTDAHPQTKSIVRPEAVTFVGVHHCETRYGRSFDGDRQPALERWIQPTPLGGEPRIHHYFTKSRAEFAAKIARGQSDGGQGKSMADFDRYETSVFDDRLAGRGPAVRRAIAETSSRPQALSIHAPWSAQSELTPSRLWQVTAIKAIQGARGSLPSAASGRVAAGNSYAALSGAPCTIEIATNAIAALRDAVDAKMVTDLTGRRLSKERDIIAFDRAEIGKPYLAWFGRSDADTVLEIAVEGVDAGGKPWRQERKLDVEASGTLGFLILSERSMIVTRVHMHDAGSAGTECLAGAVLQFH